MKELLNRLVKDNEKGIILLTLMLFSMMLLALGLTMLYQSEATYQLSSQARDNVEVFMVAETAYESSIMRMIDYMDSLGYKDNFTTAWPGDATGWPNYLLRVYDDANNPMKFRLVAQPAIDYWSNASSNRDLSSALDVSDDAVTPAYFLVTRNDSVGGGAIFKIDDIHFYRAWIEADRYQDNSPDDHTAFLMIEAFRGKPNAPIDPNAAGFLPQSHILMQYRIKLLKVSAVFEGGDVSQYGEGAGGTGSTFSSGEVDIGGSSFSSRTITETTS